MIQLFGMLMKKSVGKLSKKFLKRVEKEKNFLLQLKYCHEKV